MTPEELADELKQALSGRLRSVVLYGSAVAGDFVSGASDYNVLVVADALGLAELNAIARPAARWARRGHRPPLLFTPDELRASTDAFPIEFSDVAQSRRVLFGEDPLANIAINREHLRLQLERELKGKLLALREGYLLTAGKPRRIVRLLISSLSGVLVVFRAALRLFREDVPAGKADALRLLSEHVAFDPGPLLEVNELKAGRRRVRDVVPQALFEACLNTMQQVAQALDRHLPPTRQGVVQ